MKASSVLQGLGRWLRRLPEIALVALALLVFATAVALRVLPLTGRTVMVVNGPSMEPAVGLGAAMAHHAAYNALFLASDYGWW